MTYLSHRPLGAFAMSFYVAACILFECASYIRIVAGAVFLAAFLCFGLVMKEEVRRRAVTFVLAGCLGATLFSFAVMDLYVPQREAVLGKEGTVIGTVTEVRSSYVYGGVYVLSVERGAGHGMKVLYRSSDGELAVGDCISDTVIFTESDGEYRNYYLSDGIFAVAESTEDSVPERLGTSDSLGAFMAHIRSRLSSVFKSAMSREGGGLASALVLGDKSGISAETEKHFRTLGVSHLLSVSGTHFAVVFSVAGMAGVRGGRRRFFTFGVFAVAVFAYMILTGLSSSVMRAGIMLLLSRAAALFRRRSDPVTVLGAAVLLICLADPMAPLDMGLQLSCIGVLGVIVAASVKRKISGKERGGILRGVYLMVVTSFVTTAVMLPLLWLRFGEVSLLTPVANLVMIPAMSVILVVLVVLMMISPITPLFVPISMLADKAVTVLLSLIGAVAESHDPVIRMEGQVGAVIFALMLVMVFLTKGRGRKCAMTVCGVFLMTSLVLSQMAVNHAHDGLTFCRVSRGNDDGICFFSEGYTVLVDSGRYSSAVTDAAELGSSAGSGRIDSLVLTRLYRRHSGTVAQLLDEYYVDSVWLPAVSDAESAAIAESVRITAELRGVSVYTYLPGEILTVGDVQFSAPEFEESDISAARGMHFSLFFGGKSITYTTDDGPRGDITVIGGGGRSFDGDVISDGDGIFAVSRSVAAECGAVSVDTVVADESVIKISPGGDEKLRYQK